ncbi:MAG: nuclear transport factor 2 family protein, partial [Chitinophagaceae bacterium]|nr:nuclear transport factor 2 family protein [Chitinophagaceae bacterium]
PQYLDGVRNRQSPRDSGKPFRGEILSVKVVNSIAIAEVRVTMYDLVYHEFLSFHKIEGKWLLVNKMITDIAGQFIPEEGGNKTRLVAYIEILPAFEKEVKDALKTMAAASIRETGCEQFEVNTKKDSPNSVVVYESYTSKEAFELHKITEHAKKFFELVKGKIVNNNIEVVLLTGLNSTN